MVISEKVFVTLSSLFVVLVIVSNVVYSKFIYFNIFNTFHFELSIGAIIYPLTFFVTDLITEFYGRTRAGFCATLAIIVNIFIMILITLLDHTDATSWSNVSSAEFHNVFGHYGIASIASLIATYTSQLLDIFIFTILNKLTNNKMLWLRSFTSTSISLLVDTAIVIGFMVLFNVLPVDKVYFLIFDSYFFKLFLTACSIPILYIFVYVIKYLLSVGNRLNHV